LKGGKEKPESIGVIGGTLPVRKERGGNKKKSILGDEGTMRESDRGREEQ